MYDYKYTGMTTRQAIKSIVNRLNHMTDKHYYHFTDKDGVKVEFLTSPRATNERYGKLGEVNEGGLYIHNHIALKFNQYELGDLAELVAFFDEYDVSEEKMKAVATLKD